MDREEAFEILCEVTDYIGESFPTENKEGWLEPLAFSSGHHPWPAPKEETSEAG